MLIKRYAIQQYFLFYDGNLATQAKIFSRYNDIIDITYGKRVTNAWQLPNVLFSYSNPLSRRVQDYM